MGPERRRWSPIQTLLGVVVGMLLAGLVVPIVAGHTDTTVSASGPTLPGGSAAEAAGATTTSALPNAVALTGPQPGNATKNGGGSSAGGAAATTHAVDTSPLKIGFTLFDIGGASKLGFAIAADPNQERQAWQAYVDETNATGGINGRKIVPVWSTYDLTNSDSQQASCLALTQDAHVFAVLGGYNYPAASLCVVDTNRTLLFDNNAFSLDELYSSGRHVSIFARSSRMMATFARRMAGEGQIKGKKIGILDDLGGDPTRSVINALAAAVRANGGTVVHQSVLSGDLPSGSSQIPVEVSQMRSAGVDVVLLLASPLFGTQFVEQADSQRWSPVYAGSDWDVWYTDTGVQNMPSSFNGAYTVTTIRNGKGRNSVPLVPQSARCASIFEQRTHTTMPERGSDFYGLIMQTCDTFLTFAQAARGAGPSLDQSTFMGSVARVGRVEEAAWGGGTFAPGKFDLNDDTRVDRYSPDCKCWKPSGPYAR